MALFKGKDQSRRETGPHRALGLGGRPWPRPFSARPARACPRSSSRHSIAACWPFCGSALYLPLAPRPGGKMAAMEGPLAVFGERTSGDTIRTQNGNGRVLPAEPAMRGGSAEDVTWRSHVLPRPGPAAGSARSGRCRREGGRLPAAGQGGWAPPSARRACRVPGGEVTSGERVSVRTVSHEHHAVLCVLPYVLRGRLHIPGLSVFLR